MDHIFVFYKNMWYLKVKTLYELLDYDGKMSSRWGDAFLSLLTEQAEKNKFSQMIELYAENNNLDIVSATESVHNRILSSQMQLISKNGGILINCHGGYQLIPEERLPFVRRGEIIFPQYTENDIWIKKWDDGQHYYAYVGDMQVYDGNTIKWNTYEEAMDMAMQYIDCELVNA